MSCKDKGGTLALAKGFKDLSRAEQLAVAEHVRAEHARIISMQPATYVAKNAEANPEGWQNALRELVAGDAELVRTLTEEAELDSKPPQEPFK